MDGKNAIRGLSDIRELEGKYSELSQLITSLVYGLGIKGTKKRLLRLKEQRDSIVSRLNKLGSGDTVVTFKVLVGEEKYMVKYTKVTEELARKLLNIDILNHFHTDVYVIEDYSLVISRKLIRI